jgi:Lrp/AsnC family transcriptional regulator
MKQDLDLDQVSRRILTLLQEDATISHADLAERVGASSASCWRRIKAMEVAGYLTRTVRLVDPERVGRGVNVLCNVRMKSHDQAARTAFESYVRTRPEIIEVFSMSGEWDYLLRVVAADVADYNSFLMHQLLGHPSVAGASSHFALELVKYTTAIPIGSA